MADYNLGDDHRAMDYVSDLLSMFQVYSAILIICHLLSFLPESQLSAPSRNQRGRETEGVSQSVDVEEEPGKDACECIWLRAVSTAMVRESRLS